MVDRPLHTCEWQPPTCPRCRYVVAVLIDGLCGRCRFGRVEPLRKRGRPPKVAA